MVPTVPADRDRGKKLVPLRAGKLLRRLLAKGQRLQVGPLRQRALNERMDVRWGRAILHRIVDQLVGDFVIQSQDCIERRHGGVGVILGVLLQQL